MILRRHTPSAPLSRFVEFLWFYQDWTGDHAREHVLPDGTFELVINLHETKRRLFDRSVAGRHTDFTGGWLSGTQAQYLIIDAVVGASMIGAHFRPGGAAPFLSMLAREFRDQVVQFEAVWGSQTSELRERLLAARGAEAKFQVLEQFLLGLLRRARTDEARQRRIEWAAERFCADPCVMRIGTVADQLGISHKHFIAEFENQVGLTPKLFCRIRRFQQVLARANSGREIKWADVASDCGYYDQAHLINEFQAFAGLRPSRYRGLGEEYASFVAVDSEPF